MHPILVELGPWRILTHDAFSVLAVVVGFAIYYRELRRRGWLDGRIVGVSIAAVVGALIGARVITAWEHVEYYRALDGVPLTVAIEQSGKSLIGALAGGYLGIALAKRATGYPHSTGDAYLLAIPVATAIGRVGCFLSELPLGTPTDLPWGIAVSPEAAAAFARCPGCGGPMHPSMLYEIGFNVIAALVIIRYRDRVPVPGDGLRLYLLAAGVFRFLVEFVRGNDVAWEGLTRPQLFLLATVPLIAARIVWQVRRGAYRDAMRPRELQETNR